jgi:hypothetical protein
VTSVKASAMPQINKKMMTQPFMSLKKFAKITAMQTLNERL